MLMFMLLYRHSYLTLSLKIDFPVLICGVYKLGCREIVEPEGNFQIVLFIFFPKKGFRPSRNQRIMLVPEFVC